MINVPEGVSSTEARRMFALGVLGVISQREKTFNLGPNELADRDRIRAALRAQATTNEKETP